MKKNILKKFIFLISILFYIFGSQNIFAQNYDDTGVFNLGEVVVVTADRVKKNPTYNISEIFLEDFKDLNARNIGELMDFTEGVDVKYGGKNQSYIYIRGYEQQSIKVLVDGIPMYEPYFGLIDLSMIPIDNVSKIQIIKGPSSVLYGANTMGGVVNIISKKYDGKYKNSGEVVFGTAGYKNFKFQRADKLGKFEYLVNLSRLEFDGYRLSSDFDKNNSLTGLSSEYHEDGGQRNNSFYKSNSANVKLGYQISKENQVYLLAGIIDAERGCPVEYNRAWEFSEWKQWNVSFVNARKINDNISLKFQAYYVDHVDELKDDTSLTVIAFNSKSWFDKSRYEDYSLGANLLSKIKINNKNEIRIALNYVKDNNHQFEVNTKKKNGSLVYPSWENKWKDMGKYTTNLYSVAAEYQFLPNEKFVIQTGIAYDYFKPEGAVADTDVASGIDTPKPASTDEINSNLNLKYYYSSNLSFHCGIANKSRFPRLKELYSLHAGGNPELETEKTVSREIGLDFVHKSFKTSASLFLDNIKDYIQRNSNKEYVNLAKTEIKGLELSSIYLLNNNDYFKVNYTYLSIKDDDTNDRLTERPKHKLNAIIAKKLWYETKVMFLMSYTGEQYISTTDKVGGFCLYDINLSKNIKYKNNADFELFLNVKNIFDRDYDEGNGPSEGRNIKIGMKSYF